MDSDKTFLITGANTGIGRANAVALAERKAGRIIILSRTLERTQPVLDDIARLSPDTVVDFIPLDLSKLSSVREAADRVLHLDVPLDVLINNAGIAGVRGQTEDGFELAFGTNHVGHFLLTEKLLPLLRRAKQGRVVIVASRAHIRVKQGIPWETLRQPSSTVSGFPEYCVSKLANVLHAKELAKRLAGSNVTTYSLHPGGVASDIWRRRLGPFAVLMKPFLITNEEGAKTQVYCATSAEVATESGLYYAKERAKTPSNWALDEALARQLYERSSEWIKAFV